MLLKTRPSRFIIGHTVILITNALVIYNMEKAQTSTEFVITLAIFMIALLFFFALALDFFFSVRSQKDFGDALAAVNSLAEAANSVHAQGEGAVKIVSITLPPSTDFSKNATFIGKPLGSASAASNTISISLNGTQVTSTTIPTVVGEFPQVPGTYSMRVVSKGNFVSIGSYLISASPTSVFANVNRGSFKTSSITFKVTALSELNDYVSVSLSSPWNDIHRNVQLSITPDSFISYGFSDIPVLLTFNANSNAIGIYSSLLNVTAVKHSGNGTVIAKETFTIPLSVEVS